MTCKTLLFYLFLSSSFSLFSQNYPQNYFRSPLEIPLYLSGNFGELRSNHFHAGLDIKTQGVKGKKVIAAADGYVSRIKVSPYGYGKAIYIRHPNGYTTVYGHLKKFNEKIDQYVIKNQYLKESFSIQLFPPPDQLQVKKGEIIAYSGNSGGSGGPHLHFEIRDSKTEHPINPLFFGFDIRDQLPPEIRSISIYPMNDTSIINGENNIKRIKTYGKNGSYFLGSHPRLKLHGIFGFGIESIDRMNGTHNTYGLHNIQLKHQEQVIFEQQIDEFAFHEGRYINALIDYPYYIQRRKRLQKSYVLKGNRLRIYKQKKNRGLIELNDGKTHTFTYHLADLNNNRASIQFEIDAEKVSPPHFQAGASLKDARKVRFFPYNQRNSFMSDQLLVDLPNGVLYEDLYFKFRKEPPTRKTLTPIYWIHDHYTPLHSYINVSIKYDQADKMIRDKSLIVSTTDKKSWYPEGGKWKGNNLSVKTRSFGGYAIAIDTLAPKITPINIAQNAQMSNKWSIMLKIQDDLSGIDHFRATVDGKWILMEYDAKKDLLIHYFDDRISSGKHEFKLDVRDGVGNQSTYEAVFYR